MVLREQLRRESNHAHLLRNNSGREPSNKKPTCLSLSSPQKPLDCQTLLGFLSFLFPIKLEPHQPVFFILRGSFFSLTTCSTLQGKDIGQRREAGAGHLQISQQSKQSHSSWPKVTGRTYKQEKLSDKENESTLKCLLHIFLVHSLSHFSSQQEIGVSCVKEAIDCF